MHRFGKEGNFNIPYGGYSYNNKCLQCKIDNIASTEIQNIFKNTNLTSLDFSEALDVSFE